MSCSRSSSSALAAVALAAALAACASGDAHRPRRDGGPLARVAILPPENLSGAPAPLREVEAALERALAARGFEVVGGEAVARVLAARRVRYTGGVDAETAEALRSALGIDGVFVTTLELWDARGPKLALTGRLVAASDRAELLWIDGFARAGPDSKTVLGLGVVEKIEVLRDQGAARLAASAARAVAGRGRAARCDTSGRFDPKIRYRSPGLEDRPVRSVAVLPFLNDTERRGAGELVALAFVRQLTAVPGLEVFEPGVVRSELLRFRMVFEGGASLEDARLVTDVLAADLVLAGHVRTFDDGGSARANFTVMLIERATRRIVWESTSYASGDDRVFFFGMGHVSTASSLTCRMARGVVEAIDMEERVARDAPPPRPWPFDDPRTLPRDARNTAAPAQLLRSEAPQPP